MTGTNNPLPNQAPVAIPGVKVADNKAFPCFNCGHTLEEHRMRYDIGMLPPKGALRSAVMPSQYTWTCLSKYCGCWEWQEMDNLGYTAWKKYGNLLFLLRRHKKI